MPSPSTPLPSDRLATVADNPTLVDQGPPLLSVESLLRMIGLVRRVPTLETQFEFECIVPSCPIGSNNILAHWEHTLAHFATDSCPGCGFIPAHPDGRSIIMNLSNAGVWQELMREHLDKELPCATQILASSANLIASFNSIVRYKMVEGPSDDIDDPRHGPWMKSRPNHRVKELSPKRRCLVPHCPFDARDKTREELFKHIDGHFKGFKCPAPRCRFGSQEVGGARRLTGNERTGLKQHLYSQEGRPCADWIVEQYRRAIEST